MMTRDWASFARAGALLVALVGVWAWPRFLARPGMQPGEFRPHAAAGRVWDWRDDMNRTELAGVLAAMDRVREARGFFCFPASRLGVDANLVVFGRAEAWINPVVVETSTDTTLRKHLDFDARRSSLLMPTWVRVRYVDPFCLQPVERVVEHAHAQCAYMLLVRGQR